MSPPLIELAGESGAPLMNNCDQLVAMSRLAGVGDQTDDRLGGTSGALPDLVAFLLENEVTVQTAPEPCPSLREQHMEALEEAKRLEDEKTALATELEQLGATIAESEEANQRVLDDLEQKRSQLIGQLRRKDAQLAARRTDAERMARQQADLEERIRRYEEELQLSEKQLGAVIERERAASKAVSFLEGLLIAALVALALAMVATALVTLRRCRAELAMSDSSGQDAGGVSGPAVSRQSVQRGPGRDDVGQAEPRVREQSTVISPDVDAPTVIAGGFQGWPSKPRLPEPRVASQAAAGSVLRDSSDPVVGWLVIVDGPGMGSDLLLGYGQNSIGRGRAAQIRIDFGDVAMSRAAHVVVTYDWKGNRFYVQPGSGRNLAYMGDKPILDAVELAPGGEFTIGRTTLRLVPFCDDTFTWETAEQAGDE